METTRSTAWWLTIWSSIVVAVFVAHTAPSLSCSFAPDDMMNLHTYWRQTWGTLLRSNLLYFAGDYRPLGGLYYKGLFGVAHLSPLPYRIVYFSLLLVNILVLFLFAKRLAKDPFVAVAATALGSIHPSLAALYYNNSCIYDVLCYTFFLLTLTSYLRLRQRGLLAWKGGLMIAALLVLALNAKEMAATAPVFFLGYELLYHFPLPLRWQSVHSWLGTAGRGPAITVLVVAVFLAGKGLAEDSMFEWKDYAPEFSVSRFFHSSRVYVSQLFHFGIWFNSFRLVALWILMAGLAGFLRSRELAMAALFATTSLLPLNFVPQRGGYVLYIPLAGWAVYVALALRVGVRRFNKRQHLPDHAIAMPVALALVGIGILTSPETPDPLIAAQRKTRNVIEDLRQAGFRPAAGSCILIGANPFGKDWDLYFITRLLFDDHTLRVAMDRGGDTQGDCREPYDYRIAFRGGTIQVSGQ